MTRHQIARSLAIEAGVVDVVAYDGIDPLTGRERVGGTPPAAIVATPRQ